jgi:hypothetical protein
MPVNLHKFKEPYRLFWTFICNRKPKRIDMQGNRFELNISGLPYSVNVTPFEYNTETRFRVSYNGGEEHIFTWDSSLGRLAPIDDDSATMPDDLERAIAERLQSGRY